MRDSHQFTAEVRKVLYSLPPQAAKAACESLRNPPALSVGASAGLTRGPWNDAPPCNGQGQGAAAAAVGGEEEEEEELPYATQVGCCGCWSGQPGRLRAALNAE